MTRWRSAHSWLFPLLGFAVAIVCVALLVRASSQELPNCGTTVLTHGKRKNPEARQRFMQAYQSGRPARWEQIAYTTEGDPIAYRLFYGGKGALLRVVIDRTKDKFGNEGIVEYRCETLHKEDSRLQLTGCTSSRKDEATLVIP